MDNENEEKENEIYISPDGDVVYIHDEEIFSLMNELNAKTKNIKRASHVEPFIKSDGSVEWCVDFRPINGPIFYGFYSRDEALKFEKSYINNILDKLF